MNQKKYFKWFIGWYKQYLFDTVVMIFAPNELSPDFMERDEKTFSIEYFEKMNDSQVDLDKMLFDMCSKADELDIKLYLDKNPKKNPTPESIYLKNGFVTYNDIYLVRTPKN
jgi:hypothetical protein